MTTTKPLRTLKDLILNSKCGDSWDGLCEPDDLRSAAMEWVEELEKETTLGDYAKIKYSLEAVPNFENRARVARGKIEFITDFFNLEEK